MSIHVAIQHQTRYAFDRLVTLSPHVLRLRPAPHSRTPITAYSLRVTPEKQFLNWQQDPFGNFLARIVFNEPTRELEITVDLIADLTVINPFDFFLEESAERSPFVYEPQMARELAPYLELRERGPLLTRWVAQVDRRAQRTVDFLVELNQRLARDIAYTIRMEPGVQTCEETLGRGIGSCRDTGYLLVEILRHLGLAARFVSGYLVQLTPDEKPIDGPVGPKEDFTDLHAWAEVYVPGAGWIGLDPTSGLFAGEGHIPLAATPDPVSAAPVTGMLSPCEVEFSYANSVRRVSGLVSPAKPYTDESWQEILALGDAVDADLAAHDVRLTMGGEPTFVSVDDREGAEWNTDALGAVKRKLAEDLIRRLRARFAPDAAVLQFGQGKWYPGEVLPRWALGCFWRRDGVPVWNDEALLADPATSRGHDVGAAKRFMDALAMRLGLPPELALPGWEDALYFLWKEQNVPENLDPQKVAVDDP
jgi:transglutaminase-like putative cysteine protease